MFGYLEQMEDALVISYYCDDTDITITTFGEFRLPDEWIYCDTIMWYQHYTCDGYDIYIQSEDAD